MLSVLFLAVLGSAAAHSHDYGTDVNVPIVELQLFDAGGRLLAGGGDDDQGTLFTQPALFDGRYEKRVPNIYDTPDNAAEAFHGPSPPPPEAYSGHEYWILVPILVPILVSIFSIIAASSLVEATVSSKG